MPDSSPAQPATSRRRFFSRLGRRGYLPWLLLFLLADCLNSWALWNDFTSYMTGVEPSEMIDSAMRCLLLPSTIFLIVMSIRRLRDAAHSGWWVLAPIVCLFVQSIISLPEDVFQAMAYTHPGAWILFIAIALMQSTPGLNKYGPAPLNRRAARNEEAPEA